MTGSLVEAIKIPDYDRFQMGSISLMKPIFEAPEIKTYNITLIEITLVQGRSLKAKTALFKAINDNLAQNPGIDRNNINIILYVPPLKNWMLGEGVTDSVQYGFFYIHGFSFYDFYFNWNLLVL